MKLNADWLHGYFQLGLAANLNPHSIKLVCLGMQT